MTKTLRLYATIAAAACGLATIASARSEEWKNAKGETFSAAASQLLGPWALFDDGTLVPLPLMSDADCVRFYDAVRDQAQRAPSWKEATSAISAETYGRLLHYKGDELATDNEEGRPEPEFYMIFFTQGDKNMSWNELQRSTPALYANLEKRFPDMVQGIVFGVGDTVQDQFDISVNTHGTWLFTVFDSEVEMRTLQHRIPTNNYGLVVLSRTGVPLFGPDSATDDQVKATFNALTDMLSHMRDGDVKVWGAQRHFWHAVQLSAYADGRCNPKLIGDPLSTAVLKQMKIFKVDATFNVAKDGTITSVNVVPNGMDPKTVKMFADGFKLKTVFVPAVDHGKFVDGTYTYHLEVPQ